MTHGGERVTLELRSRHCTMVADPSGAYDECVALAISRWKFTVKEYTRMIEAGILGEDDRVELLDGEVVKMTPIGPLHVGCVIQLTGLLASRLGERAAVSVQNPFQLGWLSQPQPDLTLLRPRRDRYTERHAEPDDVLLLVEVSSSSATFDRQVKMPLYAQGGIRQAGLVDLDAGVVEVYRLNDQGPYDPPELVSGDVRVVIDAFPDVELTAADILG